MPEDLPRIPRPELVFGFVAPIGADVDPVVTEFERYFLDRGYRVVHIKVTDGFETLSRFVRPRKPLTRRSAQERYDSYISYGNQIREFFSDDSILAKFAIWTLAWRRNRLHYRNDADRFSGVVYFINQFKRKEEIELFRHVYGRMFFQVSVYSRRSARVDYLSRRFSHDVNKTDIQTFRPDAEKLVQRDVDEIGEEHGQGVGKIFHDADFIINSDIRSPDINQQINRFCELLFGSNTLSPTKIEYGMLAARAAALRSLDLSRQVGAAIFSSSGEIISQGSNEVPKALGGTYWSDENDDDREIARGHDSNDQRKRELLSEIIEIIAPERSVEELISDERIVDSQFMDALEYGRIIHAEMCAITDAARLGRSTKDAILFSTTFPCHMCAKHIVASGLKTVIFLEPYPKSLAFDLHSDSIRIEGTDRGRYESYPAVTFERFWGITPRRYRDLFPRGKRKDKAGKLLLYKNDPRIPIIDIRIPVYTRLEAAVLGLVKRAIKSRLGDQADQVLNLED